VSSTCPTQPDCLSTNNMNPNSTSPIYIKSRRAMIEGKGLVEGHIVIKIQDGRFEKITTSDQPIEISPEPNARVFEADLVTPGFVDIHTHGVGGHKEGLEFWLHPEYTCGKVCAWGTTSVIASVTFPKDDLEGVTDKVIKSIREKIGKRLGDGKTAIVDGIHAEGPIVADLGGLVEGKNQMSSDEFQAFLSKMGSDLKVMTISPSLDYPNYEKIQLLNKNNITVSLGHDKKCTEDHVLGALRHGSEEKPMHMTHLFNVQSFHHRDVGLANFGLLSKWPNLPRYQGIHEPTVEFVGDLKHLHPLVVQLILSSKDLTKVACCTDAFLEPNAKQSITYGGRELTVVTENNEDGPKLVIKGTTTMAGSCTTQLTIFHNLVNVFNVPIATAVAMLAHNPARIVKLDQKGIGSIKEGNRADVLLLNQHLDLQTTLVEGFVVHESQ